MVVLVAHHLNVFNTTELYVHLNTVKMVNFLLCIFYTIKKISESYIRGCIFELCFNYLYVFTPLPNTTLPLVQ